MCNDPDKEGYRVKPDVQFFMNYFFLDRVDETKNFFRYYTVASTAERRIERTESYEKPRASYAK